MTGEAVSAATIINAPAQAISAVLADPARRAAIDGTGWVRGSCDSTPLTAAGQAFRTAMYHAGHPGGTYQMAKRVQKSEVASELQAATADCSRRTRVMARLPGDEARRVRRSRELPPLVGLLISDLEPSDVPAGEELTSLSMSDRKWKR